MWVQKKAKVFKEVLAVAEKKEDALDYILKKHEFWKAIRIAAWIAWIAWFVHNSRIKTLTRRWALPQLKKLRSRSCYRFTEFKFQHKQLHLNLQRNSQSVFECCGRIQGDYTAYLPHEEIFSETFVANAHKMREMGELTSPWLTYDKSIGYHAWGGSQRELSRVAMGANGSKQ